MVTRTGFQDRRWSNGGLRLSWSGSSFVQMRIATCALYMVHVLYKVRRDRWLDRTENPADLFPHRRRKQACGGVVEGIGGSRAPGHRDGPVIQAQWRWPVGMPLCRPLVSGLWEVRTELVTKRTPRDARWRFGIGAQASERVGAMSKRHMFAD